MNIWDFLWRYVSTQDAIGPSGGSFRNIFCRGSKSRPKVFHLGAVSVTEKSFQVSSAHLRKIVASILSGRLVRVVDDQQVDGSLFRLQL
jgi:hypothetical protein